MSSLSSSAHVRVPSRERFRCAQALAVLPGLPGLAMRYVLAGLLLGLVALASPVLAGTGAGRAQDPARSVDELYQRGLEAYRAPTPDLASARANWSAALARAAGEGAALRAELCKSLGNVAFREERPLEAAAWFAAATRLVPRDADAWANLEFARAKAGLEPADRGDLAATFQRVARVLDLAEAEWLVLALALAALTLAVLRATRLGSAANRPLAVVTLLLAAALAPWLVRLDDARRDPLFVVSTAGITVGSEPRAAAAQVALLPAGARAERLEEVAGWTRVETAEGTRGWVASDTVFALRR